MNHLSHPQPESKNGSATHRNQALSTAWEDLVRDRQQRETDHLEALQLKRSDHEAFVTRRTRTVEALESIETDRLSALRAIRRDLDQEVIAEEMLAGEAFAALSLPYHPKRSTMDDVLKSLALPDSEAAKQAGVQVAATYSDSLLKALKYLGMTGCLLLGASGLGALIFRIPPRSLFHSPLLPVALGLGCILVGGAYLVVTPSSRRAGAMKASAPKDDETKRSLLSAASLVLTMCFVVAMVDAKAIIAMSSSHALVDPKSVPSFALAFLVGIALSAAYVGGASVLAFSEGFGLEAQSLIKGIQELHLHEQRRLIEVSQASDALNAITVINERRSELDKEIKLIERDYKDAIAAVHDDLPDRPELPEDQQKELRCQELRARFARQRLKAHERLAAKLPRNRTTGGDA